MRLGLQNIILTAALVFPNFSGEAAETRKPIEPVTLFHGTEADGTEHIGDRISLRHLKVTPSSLQPQFDALPTDEWWHGLVAVYGVRRDKQFRLSRQPPRGEENLIDPLFFALPRADGRDGAQVTGTWRCTATRPGSSDAWFVWQLTMDNEILAGRFDPSSEYRVTSVRGGTFRTNRIEVIVDYSNEAYRLTGELRDDKLAGTWEATDKEERGQWEGTRKSLPPHRLPAGNIVPLVEWHRASDGAWRYVAGTNSPGQGWSPSSEPICRVWSVTKSE
ncbi:MAG TPA: hypothetical protein VJS65_06135 [Verrucomicrobiae bacterium]|nr:hypothetical protein [Verrucomicrobiae bacterium]